MSTTPLTEFFLRDLSLRISQINPSVMKIFGSALTKGLNGEDVDILIVADSFEDVLWQYRKKILDLPSGIRFDLFLFTPEEYQQIHPRGTPFREAIEHSSLSLEDF